MTTAVLLSGGVDSSVALRLLRDEGHDLQAFYLKVWLEDDFSFLGACPWEEDLAYARAVCEAAGVPLEVVPLQREYYERIVQYALDELRRGRTPNPDIFCNRRIKFGAFLEAFGAEFPVVATGHYARVLEKDGLYHLARSADPLKDQTYFLSHLEERQLARCVFPVGPLTKARVRALAAAYELPNRDRKDSQGLCFLGKIRYSDFLESYLGERPGEIRDLDTGRVLGTHRGYWFYTIGQRRGLDLSQGPWFVVGKDVEKNTVFVTHQHASREHARRSFRVADPHWIAGPPARAELEVKLRHGQALCRARLASPAGDTFAVELDLADGGVAPGQIAVFYDGELCLGGARII